MNPAQKRRALASTAVASTLVATAWGLGAPQASARTTTLDATLRDPSGRVVGAVTFRVGPDRIRVDARLRSSTYITAGAFHGLHVHANADPANGTGCLVDPAAAPATWFVAVDGHLAVPGQTHGNHDGDLPSPLVNGDGTARLSFTTQRIDPATLAGRAVVLHAGPDNFGNVPTGSAPEHYTANSAAAVDRTSRTGNAGDRVACGVLVVDD